MRRYAFLGALLLSLALVAPVEAAKPATWGATISGAGFGGTVTVTAPTSTRSARLVADLTGLKPQVMASLTVYGGPKGTNRTLVVRTRWVGRFPGGLWHVSISLTPQMWARFSGDVAHRGGNHVVLVQGSRTTSAMLTRK
jgi:hypothetical protein